MFYYHTGIMSDIRKGLSEVLLVNLWIGLNDIADEGNFEWEDGSKVS